MAAHIFQITSLFMGMLFVLVGSAFLILLTPLVITLITSILLVTFSISAINTAFTQIGQYVNIHAPKRAILVYFADKIPSSVGRVEISHSKQRQNYDKISTNKD
jgi:expansin (peptidoglycan-binding protein)